MIFVYGGILMDNKLNFNNFDKKNIDSITRMLEKERQEIEENKDK